MSATRLKTSHWSVGCLATAFILCGACYVIEGKAPQEAPSTLSLRRIVVSGFHPSIPLEGEAKIVRSPLTGAVFMAEPLSQKVARELTKRLFERLVERGDYELISPDQASTAYSKLLSFETVLTDQEIYQRMGRIFSADAVLTGYLYRWEERQGTDYAVNRPASVAFDLCLISSSDGAVLWKDGFEKTQKSLSENLFDFSTFLKSKGRWMRAQELAAVGLAELMENLPKGPGKEKGSW
jgi:hypothetical protein